MVSSSVHIVIDLNVFKSHVGFRQHINYLKIDELEMLRFFLAKGSYTAMYFSNPHIHGSTTSLDLNGLALVVIRLGVDYKSFLDSKRTST
jgi:hypothetical protein